MSTTLCGSAPFHIAELHETQDRAGIARFSRLAADALEDQVIPTVERITTAKRTLAAY